MGTRGFHQGKLDESERFFHLQKDEEKYSPVKHVKTYPSTICHPKKILFMTYNRRRKRKKSKDDQTQGDGR